MPMYIPQTDYQGGLAMPDLSKGFSYQPTDFYQAAFQDKSYMGQYLELTKGSGMHGQM